MHHGLAVQSWVADVVTPPIYIQTAGSVGNASDFPARRSLSTRSDLVGARRAGDFVAGCQPTASYAHIQPGVFCKTVGGRTCRLKKSATGQVVSLPFCCFSPTRPTCLSSPRHLSNTLATPNGTQEIRCNLHQSPRKFHPSLAMRMLCPALSNRGDQKAFLLRVCRGFLIFAEAIAAAPLFLPAGHSCGFFLSREMSP